MEQQGIRIIEFFKPQQQELQGNTNIHQNSFEDETLMMKARTRNNRSMRAPRSKEKFFKNKYMQHLLNSKILSKKNQKRSNHLLRDYKNRKRGLRGVSSKKRRRIIQNPKPIKHPKAGVYLSRDRALSRQSVRLEKLKAHELKQRRHDKMLGRKIAYKKYLSKLPSMRLSKRKMDRIFTAPDTPLHRRQNRYRFNSSVQKPRRKGFDKWMKLRRLSVDQSRSQSQIFDLDAENRTNQYSRSNSKQRKGSRLFSRSQEGVQLLGQNDPRIPDFSIIEEFDKKSGKSYKKFPEIPNHYQAYIDKFMNQREISEQLKIQGSQVVGPVEIERGVIQEGVLPDDPDKVSFGRVVTLKRDYYLGLFQAGCWTRYLDGFVKGIKVLRGAYCAEVGDFKNRKLARGKIVKI